MNIKVTAFTVSEKSINTGQAILVRKVNIHACSMYVLFADKVSYPMTQYYAFALFLASQWGVF